MNPLQEHPHFFTNGEFKVKIELTDEGGIYDIIGFSIADAFNEKAQFELAKDKSDKSYVPRHVAIEDCTLIARPISDMTDEEVSTCMNVRAEAEHAGAIREVLTHDVNNQNVSFVIAGYLLLHGVLPFPQTLFGDTVIDSRTTEV